MHKENNNTCERVETSSAEVAMPDQSLAKGKGCDHVKSWASYKGMADKHTSKCAVLGATGCIRERVSGRLSMTWACIGSVQMERKTCMNFQGDI